MTDDWSLKDKLNCGTGEAFEESYSKEDIETLRQKLIERMEEIFFVNVLRKDSPIPTLSQQAYLKGMFGSMLNSINLLFGDPQPNITHLEKYGDWSNYWKELNKRFGVD